MWVERVGEVLKETDDSLISKIKQTNLKSSKRKSFKTYTECIRKEKVILIRDFSQRSEVSSAQKTQ